MAFSAYGNLRYRDQHTQLSNIACIDVTINAHIDLTIGFTLSPLSSKV